MNAPTIRLEIAHHLEGAGQKIAMAVELDLSVDGSGGIAAYLSTDDNARRVQLALDKITATLNWHKSERAAFAAEESAEVERAREMLALLRPALKRAEATWGRCTFKKTRANENRFWIARAAVSSLREEIAGYERLIAKAELVAAEATGGAA